MKRKYLALHEPALDWQKRSAARAQHLDVHTKKLEPADPGARFGAAIYDCVFLAFWVIAAGFLGAFALLVLESGGPVADAGFLAQSAMIHGSIFVFCLYKPVMEFLFGTTRGGLNEGLAIVDRNGRMITMKAALLRNLLVLLLTVPISLNALCTLIVGYGLPFQSVSKIYYSAVAACIIADFLFMHFHDQFRSLSDLIAGTYCCRQVGYPKQWIRSYIKYYIRGNGIGRGITDTVLQDGQRSAVREKLRPEEQ